MAWDETFPKERQPTMAQIWAYTGGELLKELQNWIEETYDAAPVIAYSDCSMQRGWNIKYKKRGKALCTIYPMKDYFIALVVIGEKEKNKTEALLPSFDGYTKALYESVKSAMGGKWLMIDIKNKNILSDVKTMIGIRMER